MRDALRHAFAVEAPGPAAPTEQERPAVEQFCLQVAKRHLTTPAIIGLEMSRPLNAIAANAMHFFSPGVWSIVRQASYEHYRHFATFLERRGSMEWITRRIEELEQECRRREQEPAPPA
jgi:hypothetical protein